MDSSDKRIVELKLDQALVRLAKDAGIDVSALTTRALKRALGSRLEDDVRYAADTERVRREIADEVAWYNRHVEEHGLFANEWRTF